MIKYKRKINSFGVIVLAAGSSIRMGKPKQLLLFRGSTLLRHAATEALASGAEAVLVVLGTNASTMKKELAEMPLEMIINENPVEGMSSSIKTGLQFMVKKYSHINGITLMVCDQPYISSAHIKNLVDAQIASGAGIVASEYKNRKGVPALFEKEFFPELLQLQGDIGAKNIIEKYADDVATVKFPLGYVDIDTVRDYESLIQKKV